MHTLNLKSIKQRRLTNKMAEKSIVLLATLLVLCSLLIGGLVTYVAFPKTIETITYVDKPVLVEVPVATNLSQDIATIKNQVTEKDAWKAEAQALAEKEWNNVKDIYNFLDDEVAISDKSDISKVVIKDTEVSKTDVDDKDAKVVQEVRVYYEDSSGDSKRANLVITTLISDGDVDEVTYELD
jgi:hypothetical protein